MSSLTKENAIRSNLTLPNENQQPITAAKTTFHLKQSDCVKSNVIANHTGPVDKNLPIQISDKHKITHCVRTKRKPPLDDSVSKEKADSIQVIDKSSSQKRNMIVYYSGELICILALILTSYATYQNIPPKISKLDPPKSFFPKGSLVHDYPTGHLDQVQHRVAHSDLSLVMFYAPWCAESQYARLAFEYAARLFYREVHFAAINCWQPGGECRHQYAKVMEWPVLMAYAQNGIAVPYNGDWGHAAITKFVQSLLNPIKRISHTEDLLELMMVHDAVVVGFVDVHHQPAHYKILHQTAVKWLERDPFQNVAFAVVTGDTAGIFGVTEMPIFRMYMWNGTVEYDNTTWSQSHLQKWLIENVNQVSFWLTPPGTKSNTLAPYLKLGPALLLFTPRNLQADSIDAYAMLRQIGMEYFNCPSVNHNWIKEMARIYITEQRTDNQKMYIQLQEQCEKLLVPQSLADPRACSTNTPDIKHVSSITFGNILNTSKLSDNNNYYCQIGPKNIDSVFSHSCEAEEKFKKYYRNRVVAETIMPKSEHKISMLKTEYDHRATMNLVQVAFRKKCEIMFGLNLDTPTIFFDSVTNASSFDQILSLSCKLNKTLSLIAIDSIVYHTFAERLGVDVLRAPNKTTAIIVDHENESTFIMKAPISTLNLINFIHNFTMRKLSRHLKPSNLMDIKISKMVSKSKSIISLREIHSKDFTKNVLNSNKTVVVLFYSLQCALCSILTQSVMAASKILADQSLNIDFVRIDGDRNDLPWQYTMEKFPSLLIFAENRKSESRLYPSSLKISVQNVLGFILANLNRPNRLHGLTLVCKNIKKSYLLEDCLNVLRKDIIDNISFSLRQWRKIPYKRGQILRRLQMLQRFYLHLYRIGNSCDFNSLDIYVRDIKKVWTI